MGIDQPCCLLSRSFTPTRNEVQHPPALSGPHVRGIDASAVLQRPVSASTPPCLPQPITHGVNPKMPTGIGGGLLH